MSAAHTEVTPTTASNETALAHGSDRLALGSERSDRRRRAGSGPGRRSADRHPAPEARLVHERRRLAADIHDLVMQDVAFALAGARAIAADPALAGQHAAAAVAAGERALAGARAIVEGLSTRERRSPAELVRESVLLAARETPLTLQIPEPEDSRTDDLTTYALVHIAREAVTNAVKHGSPSRIEVMLGRPEEWHLRVRDDGSGFDAGRVARGFGLDSTLRHAEELGGRVSIQSAPGEGTVVEVFLP